MGKASRRRTASREQQGSARAVKNPGAQPAPFVARPFAGLPGETDWVALREVVPAATATVRLAPGAAPDGAPAGRHRGHGPAAGLVRACAGSTARSWSGCSPARPPATPAATWPRCCWRPRPPSPAPRSPPPRWPPRAPRGCRTCSTSTRRSRSRCTRASTSGSPTPGARRRGQGRRSSGPTPRPSRRASCTRPTRRTGAASASAPTCAGCCRTTRTPRPTPWPGCTPAAPAPSATSTRLLGAFRACGLLVPVWELDPDARGRGLRGGGRRAGRPGSPTRSRSRRR